MMEPDYTDLKLRNIPLLLEWVFLHITTILEINYFDLQPYLWYENINIDSFDCEVCALIYIIAHTSNLMLVTCLHAPDSL